ncbi:MAG: hypothetical protein LBG31_03745 [Prevotellaceae bacterium]|jgi:DNA mismatch repair ATPase MutL|nr:hypothetical protein [Prevotellaceae bacterium]
MDNQKIIENVLQTLQKAASLLQGWKTKTMIDFDEQKTVADILRQAISDVWTVSSTDIKREKENSYLIKKLDAHKEQIRQTLATLSEQLNDLNVPYTLPEIPAEQPGAATPAEKPAAKSRSAALQTENRKISIIDTFATGNENSPALPTPVGNLFNAIGVSDKYLFTKELFNNEDRAFQTAISDLDKMKNKEEAQQYLSGLFGRIDKNNDTLKQFTALVYRRYMNA